MLAVLRLAPAGLYLIELRAFTLIRNLSFSCQNLTPVCRLTRHSPSALAGKFTRIKSDRLSFCYRLSFYLFVISALELQSEIPSYFFFHPAFAIIISIIISISFSRSNNYKQQSSFCPGAFSAAGSADRHCTPLEWITNINERVMNSKAGPLMFVRLCQLCHLTEQKNPTEVKKHHLISSSNASFDLFTLRKVFL